MADTVMNKQTEALKMSQKLLRRLMLTFPYDVELAETLTAIHKALEQPAQEPVACPYPCGWHNLYSIIIKKGAYLAQSTIGEDEVFTDHQRNEMVQIIEYAKTLCLWGKKLTHPAPSWQGLSDDEIANCTLDKLADDYDIKFARAIEQVLKEKNT